jgi:hypothetical protein
MYERESPVIAFTSDTRISRTVESVGEAAEVTGLAFVCISIGSKLSYEEASLKLTNPSNANDASDKV